MGNMSEENEMSNKDTSSEADEEEVIKAEDKSQTRVQDSDQESDDEVVKRNLINDDDIGDDDSDDSSDDGQLRRIKNKPAVEDDDSDDDSDDDGEKRDSDRDKDKEKDDVGETSTKDDDKNEEDLQDDDDDDESNDNDNDRNEDEEDDDDDDRKMPSNHVVYDFDIMMAKKKEENSRKRRRRGYDIINDNDDIIADIINQMRDAVEADIEANKGRRAATNKLKLLPFVMNQLRKIDLRDAFLDSDVLSVLTEWLAPLPDKSLPHLNIRENLLKILIGLNLYDVDRIKSSGIGKAVMYLYKHPKETKENKQRAKQLISSWSRPIFNLDSNFSAISREEREERDKELQRRARRQTESSDYDDNPESRPSKKPKEDPATVPSKPGDKGWIPRARVPAPSMKDYVIRPRSKVDGDVGKGSKRPANMLEKLMKTHQERRRASRQQRAVNMKIDKG